MRQTIVDKTSYITHIFIQDSSSSVGAGLAGLDNTDITIHFIRPGDTVETAAVAINTIGTLGTFAGDDGDFAFAPVDDTNMPGTYELHVCNDALATGADQVTISIKDADDDDVAPLDLQIRLTAMDFDIVGGGANVVVPLEASVDQANADAILAAVSGTASGSATINTVATAGVANAGTVNSDTYASTHALDGVYWEIEQSGGNLQTTLTFNVGTTGKPANVQIDGRLFDPPAITPDILVVEAKNFLTTNWDGVGVITGVNSGDDQLHPFTLTDQHVDDTTNPGEVQLRCTNQGSFGSGTIFYIDRVLCGYAVVASNVGYSGGSIWIDTLLGYAGQVKDVNGVADYPVDNLTDALALSQPTSVNLRRFQIVSGSIIDLISDASGMVGVGEKWSLGLEGQKITGGTVVGATITGAADASSTGSQIMDGHLGTCSITPGVVLRCGLQTTVTLLAAGSYVFDACYSEVAGTGSPEIDRGVAVGAIQINLRHVSSGIRISNLVAGDNVSLEGEGQLILDSTCSGGTIVVRGSFQVTDEVVGGFVVGGGVLNVDANFYDTKGEIAALNDLSIQDVRNAMSIDSTAGSLEEYSIDSKLDRIEVDTYLSKTADIILSSIIETTGRTNTSLQMSSGIADDDQYIGLTAVFQDANDDWYAKPITDYTAIDNIITWTIATLALPKDGGSVYIISTASAPMVGTNNANTTKDGYSLSIAGIKAIWDQATSALTAVGSIGKWILDKLDVVVSTRATSAKQDTMETTLNGVNTQTVKLDNMIVVDGAGNYYTADALALSPTAEVDETEFHAYLDSYVNKDDWKTEASDFVAALMADTGFTQGGAMSYEKLLNILAAMAAGNWRKKSSTVQELLDPDDSTVILEQVVTTGTNIRTITVKI